MLEELTRYVLERNRYDLLRDLLDVLIVYYIFYRTALVLRGTRAMQVVFGLLLIGVLYGFAQHLRLHSVLTLLGSVLVSAPLIAVILFQNDIRRGLMRVGARAHFGSGLSLEARVIDQVVEAATILARHRTGAIITFEQEANLDEFVGSNTGQQLDAAVNADLLVTLFIPEAMNKLHDGAVVIRDLRIAKAGVFFPMPDNRIVDSSFGSRHRAALGITEETDAVVVVVSEERGSISFCFNGNIIPNLDGPRLKAALEAVFAPKAKASRPRRPASEPLVPWARWLRRPAPAQVPPLAIPVKKPVEALPPEEAQPLRKKRDSTGQDAPRPLRKKKKTLSPEEKADSQRNPEPLRKLREGSEARTPDPGRSPEPLHERPPESVRSPSYPPPGVIPIPQSDTLKTPLRHLAPSPPLVPQIPPQAAPEAGVPPKDRVSAVPAEPANDAERPEAS